MKNEVTFIYLLYTEMQKRSQLVNNQQKSKQLSQQPAVTQIIKPELQYVKIDNKNLMANKNIYNLTYLKNRLVQQEILAKSDLLKLMDAFYSIIKFQQNLLKINGNVTVIGDIHGQFKDFIKILSIIGSKYTDLYNVLTKQCLLFLGDYVDRGFYSIQVITVIMALKVNSPKSVYCLRGNHQCRGMTVLYNFKAQVLVKYDQQVYDRFIEVFDALPVACIVNNSYFCVHGGISDQMMNIQKINTINRFQQIPAQGPFCDFMWADPLPQDRHQMYEDTEYNDVRLCSVYFGDKLANRFLQKNKLECIIRAHQVFQEGFQRRNWNKKHKNNPGVVTVFSAPNYCGIYGNKGAILHIQNNNLQIQQYRQQISEKKMPIFPDVFQLTIPQISRVINQFTKNMIDSLGKIYLKKQVNQFQKITSDQKLKILLGYVQNYKTKQIPSESYMQSKQNEKQNNQLIFKVKSNSDQNVYQNRLKQSSL